MVAQAMALVASVAEMAPGRTDKPKEGARTLKVKA